MAILSVAVLLAVTLLLFIPSSSDTDAADDIPYIDENGITKYKDNSEVTVIETLADIPANRTLTTGWYLISPSKYIYLSNTLIISGDVHIILGESSILSASAEFVYNPSGPGIRVTGTDSLTLYEQPQITRVGRVVATGGDNSAGIGGGKGADGGTITINGGNITATGGNRGSTSNYERGGAAIGGGNGGASGTITINGGTIVANGGNRGAGLGISENFGSSGSITINKGKITAISDHWAPGIATGGTLTINGGTIEAKGTENEPGINAGEIIINDGDITAYASYFGAGIGGRYNQSGGIITINGGKIDANGAQGAGIGGGRGGDSGIITITGGEIIAFVHSMGGAGIGGGYGGKSETITITGGKISANGSDSTNYGGAGIGGGSGGTGGTITITDSEVYAIGGAGAAGIGGGGPASGRPGGSGGIITITNSDIKVSAANQAAAIGGGYNANGGTVTITGSTVNVLSNSSIGGGSATAGGTVLIYGKDMRVISKASFGRPVVVGDNTFVFLPQEDLLQQSNQPAGNKIQFTAVPNSAGAVKATLPASLGIAEPLDILSGLDRAGKAMAIITSLATEEMSFELAGYYNSPITKTGAQMSAPGASVDFRNGYTLYLTIVGGDYGEVEYSVQDGASGKLTGTGGYIDTENGKVITLTQKKLTNGAFVSWAGKINSTMESIDVLSNGNIDVNETVTFAPEADTWNLKLNTGTGSATVVYDGKTFIYDSGADGMNIPIGKGVSVSATAPVGAVFANWYGDGTCINTPSFNIPDTNIDDKEYTARFVTAADAVTINLSSDPAAIDVKYYFKSATGPGTLPASYGTVSGNTLVVGKNDIVYINTDPAATYDSSLYTFIRWMEGGEYLSGAAEHLMSDLATGGSVRNLTAKFANDLLDITLTSSPLVANPVFSFKIGAGSFVNVTNGIITVSKSDQIVIRTSEPSGYEFLRWRDPAGRVISTTATTEAVSLSLYASAVTFTAMFTTTGERVTVTLLSDPDEATLYYTIGSLAEAQYSAPFGMARNELLNLRASSSYDGGGFLRWEDTTAGSPGSTISNSPAASNISMPSSGTTASYTAVYMSAADAVKISIDSRGGTGATFEYSVNDGAAISYSAPFTLSKTDDKVAVMASVPNGFEFIRWQDSEGNILSTSASSDPIDLSDYGHNVTFTAVFSLAGDRIMVTLNSDPTGAELYYKIGSLAEAVYTEPVPAERSEIIEIGASSSYGDRNFVRWEDSTGSPNVIIGTNPIRSNISLPSTGTTASYTAVYALPGDMITINLSQILGARATLMYTVNGADFQYSDPFAVLRTDVVSTYASNIGIYEFIRWQDDIGGVISTDIQTGDIDLSPYDGSEVTFTAIFSAPGGKVEVTLLSAPVGADLYYTIGSLNEAKYTAHFPMKRDESLSIRASSTNDPDVFVRWETQGKPMSISAVVSGISMPQTGTEVSYTAVYASSSDLVNITLYQTGEANADLGFSLNGAAFIYSTPFNVLGSDAVSITASVPPGFGFLRWHDHDGGTISISASTAVDLSEYGSSVSFTAMFAAAGDVITVTLASDPTGAELYYAVGSLNEVLFSSQFQVGRYESLIIRAADSYSDNSFARWESQGIPIGSSAEMSVSMPLTGTTVSYTAIYALSSDLINITLAQTGGANADLEYILDGGAFPYTHSFVAISGDAVSMTASAPSGFGFLRWQDHDGNIISELASTGEIDPSRYGSSVTFTAVFAAAGSIVVVALESDPSGADLFYTIGPLRETPYTAPFLMSKSESLMIKTTVSHAGSDFVRWRDPDYWIASNAATSGPIDMSGYSQEVTFTAMFAALSDIVAVTLISDPSGSIITYTVTPALADIIPKETLYTEQFLMLRWEMLSVRAGDIPGKIFERWEDSAETVVGTDPFTTGLQMPETEEAETFTAYFIDGQTSNKYYVITASSDAGSTISPSGKITVAEGASRTFSFSAKDGYLITEVIVDGRTLSQQETDAGSYTFRGVYRNGAIEVRSIIPSIVLTVSVVEGKGHAEYSVNGGSFAAYSTQVPLKEGWSVTVRAYADDGYAFREWRTSSSTYTSSEISFDSVGSSISLSLYFSLSSGSGGGDGNGGMDTTTLAVLIVVAAAAAFFFLWAFFFRRKYDVTIVSSVPITGKDKARRKRAYVFSVDGGTSGTISYRVGEEGKWKVITPGPDGRYVIPGKEVVDDMMIEHR
ncbi:MAG: carbohydrate-binding domain-containing protein [Candidatus Methanoplasma sp.]|jgi:hypothetical protein|nr:carbohydrate-binding domain-containing protein [Candidatus Methanoplasma sp.]